MKMIEVDGASLAYEDSGRRHGPAVLLVNALGTDFGLWDEQRVTLERSFRVLRFDVRGHGKSTNSVGPLSTARSIDSLVYDACAVLDAARVERAHWCGLSLGGMTAMRAATLVPQRVARLVLANTAAYFPLTGTWDARIELVLREGLAPVADAAAARWFTPGFATANKERVAQIVNMVRATQPAAYAACCAAIRDMDQRASLPQVLAPTLIIAGARDPGTTVEMAQFMVEQIPGADLLALDASHMSCIEQAADFSAALLDFLRS